MSYLPAQFKDKLINELELSDNMKLLSSLTLIRRAKLVEYEVSSTSQLSLRFEGRTSPFVIPINQQMRFGNETITAYEYCKRVVEIGDLLDLIVERGSTDTLLIYWIHIEFVGSESEAGRYSKKEEGLFALRTKSGEKAERLVANLLHNDYGHQFPPEFLNNPGIFTIYYKGKKVRKPDRVCMKCKLKFEVKKRNKDRNYRISHSENRPFTSENSLGDWHAFVFPDMSIHFVSNAKIISAIQTQRCTPGHDEYDSWVTLDKDFIKDENPPICP